MGHYISTTYLIAIVALQIMAAAKYVINETRLVNELHAEIIRMHRLPPSIV